MISIEEGQKICLIWLQHFITFSILLANLHIGIKGFQRDLNNAERSINYNQNF